MTAENFTFYRKRIISCLDETFSASEGEAGWGVSIGKGLSILNTTEALLAYDALGVLSSEPLLDKKSRVGDFLTKRLSSELAKTEITIRYNSHAAIGLHLVNRLDFLTQCIDRLLSSSNEDGGWPEIKKRDAESLFVPTFHAILAMQKIGIPVPSKHYDWLLSLQHSNYLLKFHKDEARAHFGPSALGLYLLSHSDEYKEKASVLKLADAVASELDLLYAKKSSSDDIWTSKNRNSSFFLYGYGYAQAALNKLGFNLYTSNLWNFLSMIKNSNQTIPEPTPTIFLLNSKSIKIPALLEIALSFKSLNDNFDPFRYLESKREEISSEISNEIVSEKKRIEKELAAIEMREKVIDEWEKEIIRQRRLSYDLEGVKDEIANCADARFNKALLRLETDAKFFLVVSLVTLGAVLYLYYRLVADPSESGFNKTDSMISTISVVIPLIAYLWGKYKKSSL